LLSLSSASRAAKETVCCAVIVAIGKVLSS
jgi:hypothetical protein